MRYLILENLFKTFSTGGSFFKKNKPSDGIKAVRGISLAIRKSEILGLVGESGSGKSTLGRLILGLEKPSSGRVLVPSGSEDGSLVDLASLKGAGLKAFRRLAQIAFQDPFSALDPRFTAGEIVQEPLDIHKIGSPAERRAKVSSLLREVGLADDHRGRYPHQFSGGQRQRLGLARALALNPSFLLADEPVSALDVSIQAQIINLLLDLKDQRNLTMLIISHDLPLIRMIADRVAVMYGGKLMEITPRDLIGQGQHHPYVEALWASAPVLGEPLINQKQVPGEPPSPKNPPSGCPFHPRCPKADIQCRKEQPLFTPRDSGLFLACHYV